MLILNMARTPSKSIERQDIENSILLKHSDGGGKASSGQFEKALLAAFARASLTGLQCLFSLMTLWAIWTQNTSKGQ